MSTLLNPTILAGDESGFPSDTPSARLDNAGVSSPYNSVGALEISDGAVQFKGTAVALSKNWILTAGHNLDIDGDGQRDGGLVVDFHLPDIGIVSTAGSVMHPDFSGFANPAINDDLALLRLTNPLPDGVRFPTGILGTDAGDVITLVGFGRSGFGSFGYTSSASLIDRRVGMNTIDFLEADDEGSGQMEVFSYDFDAPTSPDSLGNDLETIIGPGDSGGPAFINNNGDFALVGINTFTEGAGGRFGDTGGGILIEPYLPWIRENTGLYSVPEPSSGILVFLGLSLIIANRTRK